MIGQQVGRYHVLDRVGRGGMGTVYRALDPSLQREVAIKVLNAGLDDPDLARRFRAEATTVAKLSHPGIARIFELFEHDGRWLMVMELVHGETLEHLILRSGPLPVTRAAGIVMQCLDALGHAHAAGIVHRDLKPANIMLSADDRVRLMDFGIARAADSERITHVGFMMGTPAFMAPEQVLGEEVDARTDLYAMGVVLYRMVTGELPFSGETPFAVAQAQVYTPASPLRVVRPDVPAWLSAAVDRALCKDPAGRFQAAEEFREALSQGLNTGDPSSAATPSGMPRPSSGQRVLPGPRALAVGAFALAVLVAAWAGPWWNAEPRTVATDEPVEAGDAPAVLPERPVMEAAEAPRVDPAPGTAGAATPCGAEPAGNADRPAANAADAIATAARIEVPGIRVLAIDGRRGESVDATLVFEGTGVEAVTGEASEPLTSFRYADIAHATYVHARNPRWNTTLPAPPDNLDVGGIFRPSRHWLTLQGEDAFAILRLEDINVIRVIRELEARTGLVIRQPGRPD